jgi:glycosyltransferase involved in cell wall biosynthesis
MKDHISICICTYKRPELLAHLLGELQKQITDGIFTYSIVVVDNDSDRSAEAAVESFKLKSNIETGYFVEPEQNIALTRNRAVENSEGEFVAFIDDDEIPVDDWLIRLYKACAQFNADGVLGPVKPHFENEPPRWIIKGRLFERPSHRTGHVLKWDNTRTGNVLLKRKIFEDKENRFNKIFLTGEDRDFFKRMIEKGFLFVWCDAAPVYETVQPERWKRSFLLRRALFRGKVSLNNSSFGYSDILKSVVAISIYAVALPFFFLIGQHIFMKYLIKTFDHLGRLLSFFGIDAIKDKYVSN